MIGVIIVIMICKTVLLTILALIQENQVLRQIGGNNVLGEIMKKVIKDLLSGVLIIVVTLIFEFIITLPFTEVASESDRARWAFLIKRELLLTALPVALITYTFTWLLKTKSRKDALRRGIIWTCILALYYILISIGNGCFNLMFGNIGVYALLVCAFGGTMVYSALKHL